MVAVLLVQVSYFLNGLFLIWEKQKLLESHHFFSGVVLV